MIINSTLLILKDKNNFLNERLSIFFCRAETITKIFVILCGLAVGNAGMLKNNS